MITKEVQPIELRKEIEANFDIAERRYPEVLKLILAYTAYCDEHGDEDYAEYAKLESKLNEMTGKDMSQFNLWEWWEADGAENLAFDISLPDPKVVESITKEELTEVVRRIKTFEEPNENDHPFKAKFYNRIISINGYFTNFLKLNFQAYKHQLFQRNKDKDGNYFEYTQDEIVRKLWNIEKGELST
ncbi:hypothetical protein [Bacillus ndiopicus]|uniref:hypothetical protein n=1 Tax=Bacillus ndiopicus TaxID=1347368 RepID=UPI000B1ADCE9|nr:hypothetical protein [Bacillus ndiopicus]